MKTNLLLLVLYFVCSQINYGQEPFRKISIVLKGPAEFIVVDPLGRKKGVDPLSTPQVEFDEIPDAFYGTGGVDSEDPDTPGLVTSEFEAKILANGEYLLRVIGASPGVFELNIVLTRLPARGSSFSFKGIIERATRMEYVFFYNPDENIPLSAIKVIKPHTLRQDLSAAYKLNLLGDPKLFDDWNKELDKFERDLARKDSSKARQELDKFGKEVDKLREETIKHEDKKVPKPSRFITQDAYQILREDIDIMLKQLPKK